MRTIHRSDTGVCALLVMGAVLVAGCSQPEAKAARGVAGSSYQVPAGVGIVGKAGQGAVPVGQARYAVPASASFVAPKGKDSAKGSKSAPWRTLNHAVQQVRAGGVIVLRGGIYHEFVQVVRKRVTIQPYPGEKVWFDGSSRVTGWVRDGSAWRKDGWTARFDNTDPTAGASPDWRMVDPAYPMARWPDQVFFNGREQEQVARRQDVKAGSFFVDYKARRLYVGSDPRAAEVDATTLAEALYLNHADGSVVRGLGFRRYATPINRMGAVKGYADNLRFENNVFADTALTGLSITGAGIIVDRNTFSRNGQLGLQGHKATNAQLTGNVAEANNTARFKTIPVAGGIKITTSAGVRAIGNRVEGNRGHGIWLDESCSDALIARNTVLRNAGDGIQYEISDNARIAGNLVVDNAVHGISINESSRTRIWNNTAVGNHRRQIDLVDGARKGPGGGPISWTVTGTELRNNLMESRPETGELLGVNDLTSEKGAAAMADPDHDAYYRPTGRPRDLILWVDPARNIKTLPNLTEFQQKTGLERQGLAADTDAPFIDRQSFRLRPGSAPLRAGTGLPADIAVPLGLLPGARPGIGAP